MTCGLRAKVLIKGYFVRTREDVRGHNLKVFPARSRHEMNITIATALTSG